MGVVFISHSSRDNAQAIQMRDWLRLNGWRDTFLDLDPAQGLAPGQRWQEELKKAGERCSAVVVLISPAWLDSKWCQVEFLLASQLGKRIFGVVIAPVAFPDLPIELTAHYQTVDISDPATAEDGLDRLRWGFKRAGLDPRDFPWPPPEELGRQPYRGLRSMDERDAGIFFGRDAPITRGLDTLRRMRDGAPERLLVILGASGAGKSSFLKAGLLARLRRDEEHFLVLPTVRPARAALTGPEGLLHALGVPAGATRAVLERRLGELRTPAVGRLERFANAARETYLAKPPTLVLPIDQAEELFGIESGETAAACALLREALDVDHDLVLVLTIRSDSYGRLQAEPHLAEVPRLLFDLPPLSPAAFKEVIEGPGRLAKPEIVFAPELTDRLVADLDQADALPLLAFTLERLVADFGADFVLDLPDYEQGLGGLEGAINKAIDAAFQGGLADASLPLDPTALEALARRAFIPWLVKVDDAGGTVRRRVARMGELPEDTRPLVRHFVDQRLLMSDTRGEEDTVEVSHESVLRHWKALCAWIDEERASLLALDAVRRAAAEYHRHGGAAGDAPDGWLVHRGERLAQAEALLLREDYARLLRAEDRDYLTAARAREEAERAEERARLQRERAHIARQRRLQLRVGVALALVALVTLASGYVAAVQLRAASRETSLVLTDYAQRATLDGNPERAARFAALAAAEGPLSIADPAAAPTLAAAAGHSSLLIDLPDQDRGFAGAAFAADGGRVLSWSSEGAARVWNATSGAEVSRHQHDRGVAGARLAANGARVLSWSDDGTARVWDAASGTELARHTHDGGVSGAVLAADGARVLSWGWDGGARVWDASTGTELARHMHDGGIGGAVFDAEGERVLSWSEDATARIWDADSGAELARHTHDWVVGGAAFDPDGARVLSWSFDGTARVWDAITGRELARHAHDWVVDGAAFDAAGQRVLSWGRDGTARVWDAASGRELVSRPHLGGIGGAAFDPDGWWVLSWSGVSAHVWEAGTGVEVGRQTHDGGVGGAVFDDAGLRVLSWGRDGTARVWDVATGREHARQSHDAGVSGATFAAGDDRRVLSWSFDGTARVWDANPPGRELARQKHADPVTGAVFDARGARVLSWGLDGTARVWDAATGGEVARREHDGVVLGAVLDAASARALSWSGGTALVWDPASGLEVARHAHESGIVDGAVFDAQGARVLSWDRDGTARVWSASSGRELSRHSHEAGVDGAVFSPGGTRVLSWSRDGVAILWDAASGREFSRRTHDDLISGAVFDADGARVLTWSLDGAARVWDAATGRELALQTHDGGVDGAAFDPTGERVVSWGWDERVSVWDARSGREVASRTHEGGVWGAFFSGDGRRVISWGADHTTGEWDATSGRELVRLGYDGSAGRRGEEVFHAEGKRVLSWSDGIVRVWDAASGRELSRHMHDGAVRGAAFDPDGRRVLSWSFDGTARVWDASWSVPRASNRSLVAEVCERTLQGPDAPLPSGFTNGRGERVGFASIRRISSADARSAPLLRDRIGEDVCRSARWTRRISVWLASLVPGR